MLPLAPLYAFPEPWCWTMSGRGIERTLSGLKTNWVPDMGEKWFDKKQSPRISWTFFFQRWKKIKFQKFVDFSFSHFSDSGASKNDYIVLNSTVRFKKISMFLGKMLFRTLFLVGMLSITLFLGVLCHQLLTSKNLTPFCTHPLLLCATPLIQKTQEIRF